jgi:hypothetical protein
MTWQPGKDRIEHLVARRLIANASKHLETAAAGMATDDLAGAYQLGYDALRKSAAALLAVQGLRATSRGAHIAIQDAIGAQFGASVQPFKSFATRKPATDDTARPSRSDQSHPQDRCQRRQAPRVRSGSWPVDVTGLPVGALVVPASTHENRASELMLEYLTEQGLAGRLGLVLVDRGENTTTSATGWLHVACIATTRRHLSLDRSQRSPVQVGA